MEAFSPEPRFRALLFDVDDTLFNRRALFDSWANHYIRDILAIDDGRTTREILDRIIAIDGTGYGSKKELIERLLLLYPPPFESDYDAASAYADFFEATALDRDASSLLDKLEAASFPYGIATNGTMRQVEKMQKLGLTDRVPCLFVSETFGVAKPSPEIFIAAASCLGVLPAEILFVGDHPVNDILGAHNAGMSTAWLSNGQSWPEDLGGLRPDILLERLGEIDRYLTL